MVILECAMAGRLKSDQEKKVFHRPDKFSAALGLGCLSWVR